MNITKQLTTGALAALLILAPLSLSGCGNTTTLNRVGAVLQQIVTGIQGEINALESGGLITPDKAAQLRAKANGVKVATDDLVSFLNSLSEVTAGNKPQIVAKIAEAAARLAGLLQNADVLHLRPDTLFVKILNYANITLTQLSLVLAAINPPVATIGQSGGGRGIPVTAIKVTLPAVPKGAEKYITQK